MSEDHPQSKATETQIQHTESHNGQISQTRWKRKKKETSQIIICDAEGRQIDYFGLEQQIKYYFH